jgi:hypothetical protein
VHIETSDDDKGSRLLQFLLTKLRFAPSKASRGEALRIHHRSGDYRPFDGAAGASNCLGVGYGIFFVKL